MRQIVIASLWSLALSGPLAAASAPSDPFYLIGGVNRPTSKGTRDLAGDLGIYGGLGFIDRDSQAIIGRPGIDLEWRHLARSHGRIDSLSSLYTERAAISQSFYLGLGLGAVYNRVEDHRTDDGSKAKRWGIGGKAIAGINLLDAAFVEGAWFYSGKAGGVNTSGLPQVWASGSDLKVLGNRKTELS